MICTRHIIKRISITYNRYLNPSPNKHLENYLRLSIKNKRYTSVKEKCSINLTFFYDVQYFGNSTAENLSLLFP